MIRPVLAAILTLALSLPAATLAGRADTSDGVRAADAPMTLDRLRYALERDQRRDGSRADSVGRWPGRLAPLPRRERELSGIAGIRLLPDRCYDAVRTRGGTVAGYRVDCMRAAARPGDLPPHCLAQVRGTRASRTLYDARCLRSQGWTSRAARR